MIEAEDNLTVVEWQGLKIEGLGTKCWIM